MHAGVFLVGLGISHLISRAEQKIQADGAIRGHVKVGRVLLLLPGTLAPLLNLAIRVRYEVA
jgi:hypothetical protein